MPQEFVGISTVCRTDGCPNFALEVHLAARLDEHGCAPWWVCGVCREDLIPNPHPSDTIDE